MEVQSQDTVEQPAIVPEVTSPSKNVELNDKVKNDRKTIQDLLLQEGLLATRLTEGLQNLEELQTRLIAQLPQNSLETRTRYAQSVFKWFFPEGLSSISPRVACAYHDEAITTDVMRCV